MKTRLPFACISYNSDTFFENVANELLRQHKIDFWYYINHYAEGEERKAHKHCYFRPVGTINTDLLDFAEPDPDPIQPLPLICWKFESSTSFADKYLYDIHDSDYLRVKGLDRKFHYNRDDIVCSNRDYLLELIHTADFSKYKKIEQFRDMIKSNVPFEQLIANGFIPIQQVYQWRYAFDMLNKVYNKKIPVSSDLPSTCYMYNEDGEILGRSLLPFDDVTACESGGGSSKRGHRLLVPSEPTSPAP